MKTKMIKRALCIALAAGCVSAQMAVPAWAEDTARVWTEGIYAQYQTVTGKTEGIDTQNAQYTWLYSDSEGGAYQEITDNFSEKDDELRLIQGGSSEMKKYTLTPTPDTEVEVEAFTLYSIMETSLMGKWIKLKVTTPDGEFESEPRRVEPSIGNWSYNVSNSGDNKFPVVQKTTPKEYTFTVDGQEFILLDTTEDPDNRYFVMAKNTYGSRVYYYNPIGNGQTFNELSYWLDNYFLTEGNEGKKLPGDIVSHLGEIYWRNERSRWSHSSNIYSPAVLGKVAVPSLTELMKYSEKIGLQDDGVDWWTRTPASGSSTDGNDMMFVRGDEANLGKTSNGHAINLQKAIRPVFYLNDSFFADVKIPLEKMGSAVRAVLFDKYSKKELMDIGYDAKEIEECISGTISDVAVTGEGKVNKTLQGTFVNDGAAEKYISYQWMTSATEGGQYKNIPDANTVSYTIGMDAAETWVKLVITYADGKKAESEPIYVQSLWDDDFEGTVREVKLKGVYESFQNIRAEYILDDITTEDDIVYKKWYISSSQKGTYAPIEDAGEVLKTNTSYCGKYIKYGVTLKNRREYFSEPRFIGNAWNYNATELTVADGSNPLEKINATTPQEYLFTVGGQEFILLDSFESDTSAFLVMAKDIYGSRQFYLKDGGQQFTDLINWLNNDFYAAGNGGKKLPSEILSYIDMEQGWKQELRRWNSTVEDGYYGGIAIPSVTELMKYSNKIGLQDENIDWWLRTPTTSAYQDGNYMQYVSGEAEKLGATLGSHGTGSSHGIRPIFYISKDFFLENKLDAKTTGSEVYKELAKKYTKKELKHFYDNRTLEDVFGYPGDYSVTVYDAGDITSTEEFFLILVTNHIETKDAIVISNIFDQSGKLVGVNSQAVKLETEKEAEIVLEYSNLPAGEGKYMTTHVLEKKDGKLIPLFYAKTEFDEM